MADTRSFDAAAATWDQEARRVALARAVAEAVRTWAGDLAGREVLDFGCGTGLVALALAEAGARVTGADSSPGMLAALAGKAAQAGLAVGVRDLGPEGAGDLGGPYDLVASSMTLHHVDDLPALFLRLRACLRPGGGVALADLDREDGSFHGPDAGVPHLGFDRTPMAAWLRDAGFHEVGVSDLTVTWKEGRAYPVFLATGRTLRG